MSRKFWYFCAKREASFNLGKMYRYCLPSRCPYLNHRRNR